MITLELVRAVDLADSGATDKLIAASLWSDVGAVRELLRQARALGGLSGRTAIWPVLVDLLQTTDHEPDAKRLIAARAAGQPFNLDEPTEDAPMQRRKELDGDLLRRAMELSTRNAAGEAGALVATAKKHGLTRGTFTSSLAKIRDCGGTSDPKVTPARFQLDRPEVLLQRLQDGEIIDTGGAVDFLRQLESGDLFSQPTSEQASEQLEAERSPASEQPSASPMPDRSQVREQANTDPNTASEQREPEAFTELFTPEEVQALKRIAAREIGAPLIVKKSPDSEVVRIRCNSAAIAALRDHCQRHKVQLATALGQAIEHFLAGGTPGAGHRDE